MLKFKQLSFCTSFLILLFFGGLMQACTSGFRTGGQHLEPASVKDDTPVPNPFILAANSCSGNYSPGHTDIHRLTNDEYNYTVQDLLFTTSTPATVFPPSATGPSGYTNDSSSLQISDSLVSKYYDAAQALAAEVVSNKSAGGAYSKISDCGLKLTSSSDPNKANCIQQTIRTFATRAYRRPISETGPTSELEQLTAIFNLGTDFDSGLKLFLTAVLISPKFLFVSIINTKSQIQDVTFDLSDYDLASRLSYFLWKTMPDDTLFQLAAGGKLKNPATLQEQVKRMLKDPKSDRLAGFLRDEWLGGDQLTNSIAGLDDKVRNSMITETDTFLKDVFHQDQAFGTFYTADYSFLDKALADHYGLSFPGPSPTQFVKVPYNEHRHGIFSQGTFLTANGGMAAETSIVKRGKAVTTKILCAKIGPPPMTPVNPNTDPSLTGNPRQRLTHVTSPTKCSGCHVVLNNLGFGLTIYNSFGKFRTQYDISSDTIDSSGSLPGVISYSDGMDMLQQLPQLDSAKACFVQQLMSIALERDSTANEDLCRQSQIGVSTFGTTLSETISNLVLSRQFLMQTGEAP